MQEYCQINLTFNQLYSLAEMNEISSNFWSLKDEVGFVFPVLISLHFIYNAADLCNILRSSWDLYESNS